MSFKRIFIVFSLLLVFHPTPSLAWLYLEPFATSVVQGEMTNNDPAVTSSLREADLKGMNYGGRLGLVWAGFAIGGEYETATLERDWDEASFIDGEIETTNIGAFLRQQYGPLALYATYFFDAQYETDYNDQFFLGHGFKLGVGIQTFFGLNLIVEYKTLQYDEYESTAAPLKAYQESDIISAGLSIPFGL